MKPNLLLLHGALGSKIQFDSLKKELSVMYNVYDLNFEGHGGNTTEKEFTIQLFADNALEFIELNNLKDVSIFGYSMGGYVALCMAAKNPERIKKIVTLGTKLDWNPEFAAREVKMLNPEVIEEKIPFFAKKLKEEHAPGDWKNLMHKTADLMLGLANNMGLKEEDFKQIEKEVIMGVGSLDHMVTFGETENVVKLLPQGKAVSIKGFPHLIEKIETEELAEYVLKAM